LNTIAGFAARLSDQLKLPIEAAIMPAATDTVEGEAEPHRLTVAAGLAVEDTIR